MVGRYMFFSREESIIEIVFALAPYTLRCNLLTLSVYTVGHKNVPLLFFE